MDRDRLTHIVVTGSSANILRQMHIELAVGYFRPVAHSIVNQIFYFLGSIPQEARNELELISSKKHGWSISPPSVSNHLCEHSCRVVFDFLKRRHPVPSPYNYRTFQLHDIFKVTFE